MTAFALLDGLARRTRRRRPINGSPTMMRMITMAVAELGRIVGRCATDPAVARGHLVVVAAITARRASLRKYFLLINEDVYFLSRIFLDSSRSLGEGAPSTR